jgi:tetratricopeptide (TPR) repeat protein
MKPLLVREGAYFFASKDDYESSTAILSAGVEEFPTDTTLRFAMAEQYKERGDIQSAIAEYSATFAIEESPRAYFETGKLYYALGNYDSAKMAFNNAVRIEPEYNNEIKSEFAGDGMPTL